MAFDPCSCVGYPLTPQQVTPQVDPVDCLQLCHIVIPPANGVGPCGQVGQIDVMDSAFNHDITACGANPLRWSVVKISDDGFITSATITSAGILTWVTGPGSSAGKVGTVTLKGCCGELSAYVEVLIGVKDLCICPECEDCENCDPCTGDCLDVDVDALISGS